jgi:uncharacterized protein (TIGR01244 family)
MKLHPLIALSLILAACIATVPVLAQEVTKETVEGITNFSRIQTTVACAGAITVDTIPKIKEMGFVSIINLRLGTEPGADVAAEQAAAKSAGLRYYHIPFDSRAPDPLAVDAFLDAITAKGTEPAFIHCAGGSRAATMWFIKRLVVDHWDLDRAAKEASQLGMTNPALKQFAIDYSQTHKR